MSTATPTKREITETARINQIMAPWLQAFTVREPFTVTLTTGKTIEVWCPLGAAVEIETAGHKIIAI